MLILPESPSPCSAEKIQYYCVQKRGDYLEANQNTEAESKEKHGEWDPTVYAGVDYNLTLCPLQSRLQRIYYGQPYAGVDFTSMPESTVSPGQGLKIWPQEL